MSEDKNIINKYNNGKIYTIRCTDDNNLIYCGSTVQPLYKRWHQHKKIYNKENNKEYNKLLYIKMREIGIYSFYIELYENFNCDNIEQLLKREGEVIREIGNLNKKIEGRTHKESQKIYYEDNKEKIIEQQKQYKNDNKEKIIEQQKQYYNEHKFEKHKKYYIKNKEQILERQKKYNKENKEQILERRNENKEAIKERRRKLYKLKKLQKQEQEQQPTGPESPQEIII